MNLSVTSITCNRAEHQSCPIYDRCSCDCHRDWRRLGLTRQAAARFAAAQVSQYFASTGYGHAGNLAALPGEVRR
jgi:hypothetical protein